MPALLVSFCRSHRCPWSQLVTCLLMGWLCAGGQRPLYGQAPLKVPVVGIRLIGNKVTRPWVIERELTFAVGDSLLLSDLYEVLKQNRRNVLNLNLFQTVEVLPVRLQNALAVQITVKERFPLGGQPIFAIEERNSYDIIGAFMTRNFRRLVYGGVGISRNLTGRGELIDLGIQWGFSRRLRVRFVRPNLFPRFNLDLRAGVAFTEQPEIMVGTVAGTVQWITLERETLQRSFEVHAGLNKRWKQYHSLYTEVNYHQYRLADSLYAFMLEGHPHRYLTTETGKEQYFGLKVVAQVDRRDWRSFPQEGYLLRGMARLAGGPGATTQFAKLGVSWAQHLPLGGRFNFAYGLQSIYTFGKQVPFFEKSQVGILRTEFAGISTELRGYEPYVIAGTFLNLAKAELKFAVLPYQNFYWEWIPIPGIRNLAFGCYLSAFVDLGYVEDESINNQDRFLKEKVLSGYGLGLNLIGIYDMLLRIEMARNHLGQPGIYLHGTLPIK